MMVLLPLAACASLLGDDFTVVPAGEGGAAANTGGAATGGSDGGGEAGGGSGAGGIGPGPKIASSIPVDGDQAAGFDPYAIVHFDRVVTIASAAGKFFIEGGGQPKQPASVVDCPIVDPTCIGVLYPAAFASANGKLPGESSYVLTVDKGFEDTDGNANFADQTVSFTTYPFDPVFYDDSDAIEDEAGGIVFFAPAPALILVGQGDENNDGVVLRRVDLDEQFNPVGATTIALPGDVADGGGPLAYGLDLLPEPQGLYVNYTYERSVLRYQLSGNGDVVGGMTQLNMTSLPAPNDELYDVITTTAIDGRLYFGFGFYFDRPDSIIEQNETGGFASWLASDALWDDSEGFHVVGGTSNGADVMYVANQETILKIDYQNKQVINDHTHFDGGNFNNDTQMRIDSAERLYVSDGSDLVVYATSGADGFTELARRNGLGAGRFDIREDGATVHIYFIDFRGDGVIGHASLTF